MCGRYSLHINTQTLAQAIAQTIPECFEPSYNISPGSRILAIAKGTQPSVTAGMMPWGLRTPHNFHINARLETANTTPRFRDSWATRRCLIPACGFYEWHADGVTKQPYYIYAHSNELLFFAGLWFPANTPNKSSSCVLLTTQAHQSIQNLHQRMPVTLPKSVHTDWLENEMGKDEVLAFSNKISFATHKVSNRVNKVHNNDSHLILATTTESDAQMQLF